MQTTRVLTIANPIALVVTLVLNGLAGSGALNGVATGDISDSFDNKIVPAGFTFAIWGVIYLLLIAFAGIQLLQRKVGLAAAEKIGPWFVLSCAANIGWLLCWHYRQFATSMLFMLALLAALILCYVRLRPGALPGREWQWFVQTPISVYLGWITVATVVNAAVVLLDAGWNGLGISPAAWSAIMIGVACVVAGVVGVLGRDAAYLLVLVWALFGIASKHASLATVAVAAAVGAAGMAALALWQLIRIAPRPQHG